MELLFPVFSMCDRKFSMCDSWHGIRNEHIGAKIIVRKKRLKVKSMKIYKVYLIAFNYGMTVGVGSGRP